MTGDDAPRLSRRQVLTGAGLAAAGSLAVGPGALAGAPDYEQTTVGWRMPGRTPARTGFAPDAGGAVADLSVEWTTAVGDAGADPSLAAVDGSVVATTERRLVSLDAESGDERWRYGHREDAALGSSRSGYRHVEHLAVREETAFVTAGTSVVAVDRSTGRRRWGFRTNSSVEGLLAAGNALFASARYGDDDLLALDATRGYRRWSVPAGDLWSMAFADGRLFGVTRSGADAVAVDPEARTGRWREPVPDPPPLSMPLVAAHDAVVVPAAPVVALEAAGGTRRWTRSPDGEAPVPAVAADDERFVVANGAADAVTALDPTTGEVEWRRTVDRLVSSAQPVLTPDALFVAVADGVAALDPSSGDELARTAVDATVEHGATLALADDRLYLAADDPLRVAALSYR